MLISDILTLIFALQLINSKNSRPDFYFHKIHVEGRVIISQIFFKIYHISTKCPAIIHTAETIKILSQFNPEEKMEGYMLDMLFGLGAMETMASQAFEGVWWAPISKVCFPHILFHGTEVYWRLSSILVFREEPHPEERARDA